MPGTATGGHEISLATEGVGRDQIGAVALAALRSIADSVKTCAIWTAICNSISNLQSPICNFPIHVCRPADTAILKIHVGDADSLCTKNSMEWCIFAPTHFARGQ